MSRHAWAVALCAFVMNAWSAQLFIPLDENGNPIESGANEPSPSIELDSSETPESRATREQAEAWYAEQRNLATVAYVDCLNAEMGRLFGTDYERCNLARAVLANYLPAEPFPVIVACIEEQVLGSSRSGGRGCAALTQSPAVEADPGVRWP